VLVLGYPQLFPKSDHEQRCAKLYPWRGDENMLRDAGDRLNRVIEQAAAASDVEYVDVARRWAGHEICGDKG